MRYKMFVRKIALLVGTGALLSSIAVTTTGAVTVSASNTPVNNGYIAYRGLVGSPTAKGITQDGVKTVTADSHIKGAPTASADGSKITWREQSESTKSWAIKVADGDGSNSFTVVGGTWIDPSSAPRNVPPSMSPDGTKIVFAHSTGSGQNIVTSIYVVDAVSGSTKTPDDFSADRNSNTANQAVNVGTSADPVFITNTKYAFAGVKGTGAEGCSFIHGIYVTDIADTTSTFLPGSCASSQGVNIQGGGFLSASPDGLYVAYNVYDGSSPAKVRLYVSKTDGTGTPFEVFDIPGDAGGSIKPAFSPDGKYLAFGFSYFGASGPVTGIQIATRNNGATGTPESLSGFTGEPFQMTWLPGNVSLSTTTPAPNPSSSTDNVASSDTNTSGSTVAAPANNAASNINVIPGVTKSDTKVYTVAPQKVAANSSVTVLTRTEAKTRTIVSNTPSVCIPNRDSIIFIDEGRCRATIRNKKSGEVLRRFRTIVVNDEVSELKVGNEVAIIAPIYFDGGSSEINTRGMRRIRSIKEQITAAGSVLVVGHSGIAIGVTEENVALSKARANSTVAAMKKVGAKGPFFATGVGGADPLTTSTRGKDQTKNRRVVVILVP